MINIQKFIPSAKSKLSIDSTSILQKAMRIVLGFLVLGMAHFVGYQLKSLIYLQGRQDIRDIVKKDTSDGVQTKTDNLKQAKQTKLVFVTIGQIVYYAVILVGVLIVLKVLGIETASIIALIGTIGFALGLALQGSLSDIASGILLALLQMYSIGDIIQVDDMEGKVKDFNMFHTVLEDIHTKTVVTIPNRKIQEGVVINHTKEKVRVVVVDILVSNKTEDFNKVIALVVETINQIPGILKDPAPIVGVASMAEVGTTVRAKVAIPTSEYPEMVIPIKTTIRDVLAKNNVVLVDPF
jgi:small conductance mechanosensitive channel